MTHLNPMTLDERLCVCENAKHHMLHRALLLKDHSRQIQQHLIALHFQLTFFIQLRVPQPDATKLQITGKYFFVGCCKGCIIRFVDHLQGNQSKNKIQQPFGLGEVDSLSLQPVAFAHAILIYSQPARKPYHIYNIACILEYTPYYTNQHGEKEIILS